MVRQVRGGQARPEDVSIIASVVKRAHDEMECITMHNIRSKRDGSRYAPRSPDDVITNISPLLWALLWVGGSILSHASLLPSPTGSEPPSKTRDPSRPATESR